jgi:hypothetical protein
MHASGIFKFEDFQDTVHLHAGGGAKLLDEMAKVIANDEPSMAALGLKNNQGNRAVAGREEPSL